MQSCKFVFNTEYIGNCRNGRGLGKSKVVSVFLKNQDILMKDQLNLRVFTKSISI